MRSEVCFLLALVLVVAAASVPIDVATATDVTDRVPTPLPSDAEPREEVTSLLLDEKDVKDEQDPREPALASEVSDMLRDPYRPIAEAETEKEDKEDAVDGETVPVVDSHVVKINMTHESDSMSPSPVPEHQQSQTSQIIEIPSTPSTSLGASSPSSPSIPVSVTSETSNKSNSTTGNDELSSKPDGNDPVKSTGLSTISIVSVSRVTMSPPTEVAAILSLLLLVSAVAGYMGMLAWRKVLEKRYGNREMLVNEDDDLRHFEL